MEIVKSPFYRVGSDDVNSANGLLICSGVAEMLQYTSDDQIEMEVYCIWKAPFYQMLKSL